MFSNSNFILNSQLNRSLIICINTMTEFLACSSKIYIFKTQLQVKYKSIVWKTFVEIEIESVAVHKLHFVMKPKIVFI